MTITKRPASKRNHANVIQHIQGYFKKFLSSAEKTELVDLLNQYRRNELPLMATLTILKHYL